MAKVVGVVVFFFMFRLYFSPCLTMMTGGISRVDERDMPEVIKEGVRLYLKNINEHHSVYNYKAICEKLEASSQIVQGALYRVALEIIPVEDAINSDCIQGSDSFLLEKGDKKFVCLTIWSRPWLSESKRLIVKQVSEPDKRNDVDSCLEVNSE